MNTAIITATFKLDLGSACWPENMTDEEKLLGWLFAARQEPEVAFKCLIPDEIEGSLE